MLKSRRRLSAIAFTLVEMLAVMAVLAILAVATVPVVTSLSKSSSRKAAATLVLSHLEQARALAISQNAAYYVVFADGDPAWPESLRYRAFSVFKESFNPKSSRYELLPTAAWTILPEGISFKPDGDEQTVYSGLKEIFYCQPASRELAIPFLKFNSLGGLDEPTSADQARIRIFEGVVDKSGKILPSTGYKERREELITLSLATGRPKRQDLDTSGL